MYGSYLCGLFLIWLCYCIRPAFNENYETSTYPTDLEQKETDCTQLMNTARNSHIFGGYGQQLTSSHQNGPSETYNQSMSIDFILTNKEDNTNLAIQTSSQPHTSTNRVSNKSVRYKKPSRFDPMCSMEAIRGGRSVRKAANIYNTPFGTLWESKKILRRARGKTFGRNSNYCSECIKDVPSPYLEYSPHNSSVNYNATELEYVRLLRHIKNNIYENDRERLLAEFSVVPNVVLGHPEDSSNSFLATISSSVSTLMDSMAQNIVTLPRPGDDYYRSETNNNLEWPIEEDDQALNLSMPGSVIDQILDFSMLTIRGPEDSGSSMFRERQDDQLSDLSIHMISESEDSQILNLSMPRRHELREEFQCEIKPLPTSSSDNYH